MSRIAKPKPTPAEREFAKIKRFVLRHYPNATTRLDESTGEYWVQDEFRQRVVPDSLMLPPARSVREAWTQAKQAIWFTGMVRKSYNALSDEKIFRKIAKENKE